MEEEKKLGCVYFVKLNGLSPIKIGFSSSPTPSDRVEQFSTCAPYGVELVGFIQSECASKLERKLHDKFKAYRLNGEWFEISKEQARSVCEAMMSDYQKDQLSLAYELISKGLRIAKKKVEEKPELYPAEFHDWCKSIIVFGDRLDKNRLYKDFVNKKVVTSEVVTQRKLTSWIHHWCRNNGIELRQGKSGPLRWVIFNHGNVEQ